MLGKTQVDPSHVPPMYVSSAESSLNHPLRQSLQSNVLSAVSFYRSSFIFLLWRVMTATTLSYQQTLAMVEDMDIGACSRAGGQSDRLPCELRLPDSINSA